MDGLIGFIPEDLLVSDEMQHFSKSDVTKKELKRNIILDDLGDEYISY